ncbi:uncharacterized protein LOC133837088 [Drosophila sulfurigaster albostrigata]|uniref:uncharacterized protein LOC133836881 n=1 Tax=Drosophila sulfurigaster albostrigata TaxID=89887 RepID=UPI002D21C0A4|nr:uncharacterized protein LOC133836881 [Drosophila sulfurigaster albostrigata]XP_062123729.1 uncharacterized protein LOC133837088 [Drosophila sulfurigaster albostrigata]
MWKRHSVSRSSCICNAESCKKHTTKCRKCSCWPSSVSLSSNLSCRLKMRSNKRCKRLALSQDEVSALRTSSQRRNHSNSNSSHSNSLNDSSGELWRLTNEVESLRCVLELKQAEISTLHNGRFELQRENDEQRSLSNRVTLLEAQNEMMRTELESKTEKEKDIQRQMEEMQKAFNHESIKSAKQRLYRFVGRCILNFDELRTLICQIVTIINSRPLISISENPDDLDVLIPAYLLFGGPPTVILEPDLTTLDYNRLDAWQRVTQLQQVFWTRWRVEYLTLLQQRCKWRSPDSRLQVNDVVLVKDENLPSLHWLLARVMALIPGKDGKCQVAELKTSCGSTRRAINKLCLLHLKNDVGRQAFNGGSLSEAADSAC